LELFGFIITIIIFFGAIQIPEPGEGMKIKIIIYPAHTAERHLYPLI
jgi:hypothetical protein